MKTFLTIALACTALLLCGCQNKQKATGPIGYTIEIATDETRGQTPVEVHLVALDFQRSKELTEYKMGDYWRNVRSGKLPFPAKVLKFSGEAGQKKIIDANDPIWVKWMNSQRSYLKTMHLYVLADLTERRFKDEDGTLDRRRMIVPLDPARWGGNRNIRIKLLKDDVICLTEFIRLQAK